MHGWHRRPFVVPVGRTQPHRVWRVRISHVARRWDSSLLGHGRGCYFCHCRWERAKIVISVVNSAICGGKPPTAAALFSRSESEHISVPRDKMGTNWFQIDLFFFLKKMLPNWAPFCIYKKGSGIGGVCKCNSVVQCNTWILTAQKCNLLHKISSFLDAPFFHLGASSCMCQSTKP